MWCLSRSGIHATSECHCWPWWTAWAGGLWGKYKAGSVSAPHRGIYLCGHSAGAHLASMMLLASWTEHGVVPNLRGNTGMVPGWQARPSTLAGSFGSAARNPQWLHLEAGSDLQAGCHRLSFLLPTWAGSPGVERVLLPSRSI